MRLHYPVKEVEEERICLIDLEVKAVSEKKSFAYLRE
jgi:hypothetical protein